MKFIDTLFTPADFEAMKAAGRERHACVVFDILRATSSMVTALHYGATGILPAASIAEAMRLREANPGCLLAGERDGVRIRANLTGSIDFDLGNSPREFVEPVVKGRKIVMTTTNGTRALRACAAAGAGVTLIAAFLNLQATAEHIIALDPENLILVCGGTYEYAAYEDILCAGALAGLLRSKFGAAVISDATYVAQRMYQIEGQDILHAFSQASNGSRLLSLPELRDDVPFCARMDSFPIVAGDDGTGEVSIIPGNHC